MKKFYLVPPILTAVAFTFAAFEIIISLGMFFLIPIICFWYFHRNEIDIFLEPSSARERICFFALSNRQLIAFVAHKISEKFLRVEDKLIQIAENDIYVYRGKIVMFIQQAKGLNTEQILELKNKLDPGFLSKRAFLSNSFLKSLLFPASGTVLIWLNFPSIFVWPVLLFGPQYLLYMVWDSGALDFAGGQSGDEVDIFYITGSRKLKPTAAVAVGEKWWTYKDGLGNVKLTDGTDYYFHGNKVFLSGAGVSGTFSLEMADKATWFANIGLRDWRELKKAVEISEEKNYDSLEEAHEDMGMDLIRKVRKRIRDEQKTTIGTRPIKEVKSVAR